MRPEIHQLGIIMDQGHAELLNNRKKLQQHLQVVRVLLEAEDLDAEEVAELKKVILPTSPQILSAIMLTQEVMMASVMLGAKIAGIQEGS